MTSTKIFKQKLNYTSEIHNLNSVKRKKKCTELKLHLTLIPLFDVMSGKCLGNVWQRRHIVGVDAAERQVIDINPLCGRLRGDGK